MATHVCVVFIKVPKLDLEDMTSITIHKKRWHTCLVYYRKCYNQIHKVIIQFQRLLYPC